MIITITEIGEAKHQSKGKSHWSEFEIKYTNDKGMDSKRTMRSFDNTWEASKEMAVGKTYDVGVKKNDKGFWEWTSVKETTGGAAAPRSNGSNSTQAAGGYWDEKFQLDKDRFEFDKFKQPLIIRQSCLSSAVAFCARDDRYHPDVLPERVIEIAKMFEEYVNSEADLRPMEVE